MCISVKKRQRTWAHEREEGRREGRTRENCGWVLGKVWGMMTLSGVSPLGRQRPSQRNHREEARTDARQKTVTNATISLDDEPEVVVAK